MRIKVPHLFRTPKQGSFTEEELISYYTYIMTISEKLGEASVNSIKQHFKTFEVNYLSLVAGFYAQYYTDDSLAFSAVINTPLEGEDLRQLQNQAREFVRLSSASSYLDYYASEYLVELRGTPTNYALTVADYLAVPLLYHLNTLYAKNTASLHSLNLGVYKATDLLSSFTLSSKAGYMLQPNRDSAEAAIEPDEVQNVELYLPYKDYLMIDLFRRSKNFITDMFREMSAGVADRTSLFNDGKVRPNQLSQARTAYNATISEVRTIITDSTNAAMLDTYKNFDILDYQFIVTLDERTCDMCAPFDMKIFNVKSAKRRINLPALHNNCRCTTIPVFPEDTSFTEPPTSRLAKDANLAYVEIPSGLTFEEYAALREQPEVYAGIKVASEGARAAPKNWYVSSSNKN